jgi:hypothetical protein
MRYDELEWGKRGARPTDKRSISQLLVRVKDCAEPCLSNWAAYRVVVDLPTDKYTLRAYKDVTEDPLAYANWRIGRAPDSVFGIDRLVLACILVHLEPAEKR